jgi:DNA repair photolyase
MNGKPVFTVPARTIINFKSGFGHKLLCDDMTFTTGSACAYSCSFCYVESMQRKQQEWFKEHGVEYPEAGHAGVVIRNENPIEIARKQIQSKPEAFRKSPKVIYSSPKVDVAANMDLVRETVEMCKLILANTAWHIRLLSKSNLLPKIAQALSEPVIHDQGKARVIYGVSTGTLDDKLAQAFEEGCPLVSKRIQSLHWLQDNGFRTFGMVCPSLPDEGGYKQFASNCEQALRYDRCEHVWAEVINVRGESFVKTAAALMGGGYSDKAAELTNVYHNKQAWEEYARGTFLAHKQFCPPEKLRFLQYVTKDTEQWWSQPGVVKL